MLGIRHFTCEKKVNPRCGLGDIAAGVDLTGPAGHVFLAYKEQIVMEFICLLE